jgi:hypothetical protein
MNAEQLIDQYLRLKRKLAATYGTWHSGRIDRLAGALQSVERELRTRRVELPRTWPGATSQFHG